MPISARVRCSVVGSGTGPLENCFRARLDGPRASNLLNRISDLCFSEWSIFLAKIYTLKIVEETKSLDDISFPRSNSGELAQSESQVL
jgi:hypothetical protein